MSSSFPVAMPSLPPMVLLPSAAQPELPVFTAPSSGAPATVQPNSSANLRPTATSFANLIDEFAQEVTQQTGNLTQPIDAKLAALRIPLRTRSASPSPSPSPARTTAAPQKSIKATNDNVIALLPVPVQTPPVVLPRIIPAAPAALALAPAATAATAPGGAVQQAPQLQSGPPETLRLAPDDTVLQIHLRTLETDVSPNPAPVATQKEAAAPAAKPTSAPTVQTADDTQVQAIGDDAKPTGGQPDMRQGDSKHLPQRANSPEHEDAPKAAAAQPFVQTLSTTHQMTVPAAAVVEKQVPPAAPAPAPVVAHAAPPEPETAAEQPQQVRSVALEFTPDGGRDVRLRVVERAGEVHVTLHSNDADLTGKLRDGVQDLAGSLTSAGYDGEAWTPRDGRQQHQQQQETPAPARRRSRSGESKEEFAGLFSYPAQETK